jgi:hypothetical protein
MFGINDIIESGRACYVKAVTLPPEVQQQPTRCKMGLRPTTHLAKDSLSW